jgi:hypothetical protein
MYLPDCPVLYHGAAEMASKHCSSDSQMNIWHKLLAVPLMLCDLFDTRCENSKLYHHVQNQTAIYDMSIFFVNKGWREEDLGVGKRLEHGEPQCRPRRVYRDIPNQNDSLSYKSVPRQMRNGVASMRLTTRASDHWQSVQKRGDDDYGAAWIRHLANTQRRQ